MIRMLRTAICCVCVGFVVPTLAFATIGDAPTAAETRKLFQLSYADAEGAIGFALADKGAGDKVSATIAGHSDQPIFSYDKPITVEIRGLKFDKQASRWNASLLFVSEGKTVSAIPVGGQFDEMVEVPVLKRPVKNGDVIADKDVELKDYPIVSVRSDVVTDLASLVGKSPLRTISAARPVREQEIARPASVKKNSLVQMQYNSPGMKITAAGQAMEDGATGSVISVRNSDSKKIIRAMVLGAGQVEIVPAGTQASQLVKEPGYETN